MKRIIYTAVALILCASVFGIADYYNAEKQGTLVQYTDEEPEDVVVSEKKEPQAPVIKEPVLSATTKKESTKQATPEKKIKKQKSESAHYTEPVPNVVLTEKTTDQALEKVDPVTILESKTTLDTADTVVKEEKEVTRKISMEMFSRAPIRTKKVKK